MATASVLTTTNTPQRTGTERWYFTILALVMIAVSCAGFLPSLAHPSSYRAPLPPVVIAHGIVYFAWQILFLIQSGLVATRRVTIHRRLGIAGAFLLALMIPLGYAVSISLTRRGFDLSGDLRILPHPTPGFLDPIDGLLFPLTDIVIFAPLAIAALALRSRREIHKRLMLFANIMLMGAPLQHFIGYHPALASVTAPIIMIPITLFLVSAVVRDYLVARRIHPLTWTLAILLFASGPLRAFVLGPSAAWRHFAAWLIG